MPERELCQRVGATAEHSGVWACLEYPDRAVEQVMQERAARFEIETREVKSRPPDKAQLFSATTVLLRCT